MIFNATHFSFSRMYTLLKPGFPLATFHRREGNNLNVSPCKMRTDECHTIKGKRALAKHSSRDRARQPQRIVQECLTPHDWARRTRSLNIHCELEQCLVDDYKATGRGPNTTSPNRSNCNCFGQSHRIPFSSAPATRRAQPLSKFTSCLVFHFSLPPTPAVKVTTGGRKIAAALISWSSGSF